MKRHTVLLCCCFLMIYLLQQHAKVFSAAEVASLPDDEDSLLLQEMEREREREEAESDLEVISEREGAISDMEDLQKEQLGRKGSRPPGGRRGNVRSKLGGTPPSKPVKDGGITKPTKHSGGSSFYGVDQGKEQRELLRKREAVSKSKEKSRISSMSGDRRRHLEHLLGDNIRVAIAQAEVAEVERNVEDAERRARYRISRKHARPVEDILRRYDAVDVDLYALLGVSRQWDEHQAKKQYRTMALRVHPDKNPHPDAKMAFDALKDAYDTLSSPSKRADYDKERKKMANARRITWKRLQRKTKDCWQNSLSLLQMSLAQRERGETMEIFNNLKERLHFRKVQIQRYWEHLLLLPDVENKLLFLGETVCRHKRTMLMLAVVGAMLFGRSASYPDLKILFAM